MRRGPRFYAELPGRRLRQIVGDGLVLAWVVIWILVGQEVHSRAKTQGQGAQKLETAGGDFSQSMGDAGGKLRKVPLIGDDIEQPFTKASSAGSYVAQAGRDIQVGTDQLGQMLGILTAALPIALVVAFWLQARLRYARRVRIARALEGHRSPEVDAVRVAAGLDLASLGLRPATDPASTPPADPTTGANPAVSAPLPTVPSPAEQTGPIRRPGPPDQE